MTMNILKVTALATLLAAGSTFAYAQDGSGMGGNQSNSGTDGGPGTLSGSPITGPDGDRTGATVSGEGDSAGNAPINSPCPAGYAAKDDGTCAEENLPRPQ